MFGRSRGDLDMTSWSKIDMIMHSRKRRGSILVACGCFCWPRG